MSDEKGSKNSGAFAAAINALHPDARGALSAMIVFFAFFLMMYALVNMPTYFKNLVSASGTKDMCWELKELPSGAVKFNKCTGELVSAETKPLTK